MLCFTA